MQRKKRSPKQKAKDNAWDSFSIYIRTRDCLKTTGNPDEGLCCTCSRLYSIKQLQAGHFIPGRHNSVLFSEQGVHAQCFGCNGNPPYGKAGNLIQYWPFMERTYSREIIDKLIEESKQT